MVVNAPEAPVQAEVVFAIETTSANGAYIQELKTNYIIPTLEYFHGGALEQGMGCGSIYAIVTYQTVDSYPGLPVSAQGPFSTPQEVIEAVDKIEFSGGLCESRACVAEALTTALTCFDDLGRTDLPMHILLLCCSPPFAAYGGGIVPIGCPATVEQAARLLAERGVQLSIACARKVSTLLPLYENAGGDTLHAQQRNYAKDPRHLVLLRGYSLKERPPSPAPPPVPDIQTDVYGQGRGAALAPRLAAPLPRAAPRAPWPRQPIYQNNSALLTQLTQPSYPPPSHPGQAGIQRMPGMVASTSSPAPAPPQRSYIWSGVLEWMEKGKPPGDQQKVTKHLPCQVSANSKDIEPELKVDTWPNKLLMQLMPKQLISNIGGQYLKDSKSVLFHLQPNEALDALTKVMVNGFAGCVHFSPMQSPPQCDIKVLILLYTPDKKAYLGFIPNNQATFVERLRKVIQQQKIMNKQLPAATGSGPMPTMPNPTMAGGMAQPGMSAQGMPQAGMPQPGMSQQGMSQPGMNQQGMTQQGMTQQGMTQQGMTQQGMAQQGMTQQGMTQQGMSQQGISQAGMGQSNMSPGMMNQGQGNMMQSQQSMMMGQQSGKGPRGNQLDGLEAARQHNLEKIQHLQQTLEAAHQQEAQFKSQMDIMGHLQAAQQQEQHYKQLEEQRKHQQLQQQLQQQLRGTNPAAGHPGAGHPGAGHPGAGHPARIMRPMMPSNPGLRLLLQQQPQYRPSGGPRPSNQQQFDDVNNYNEFL